MDLYQFNDDYLNILRDKISKENKPVFLFGDVNVDHLKYDKDAPTNEFYHISLNQLESELLPKPLLIIFY